MTSEELTTEFTIITKTKEGEDIHRFDGSAQSNFQYHTIATAKLIQQYSESRVESKRFTNEYIATLVVSEGIKEEIQGVAIEGNCTFEEGFKAIIRSGLHNKQLAIEFAKSKPMEY